MSGARILVCDDDPQIRPESQECGIRNGHATTVAELAGDVVRARAGDRTRLARLDEDLVEQLLGALLGQIPLPRPPPTGPHLAEHTLVHPIRHGARVPLVSEDPDQWPLFDENGDS